MQWVMGNKERKENEEQELEREKSEGMRKERMNQREWGRERECV